MFMKCLRYFFVLFFYSILGCAVGAGIFSMFYVFGFLEKKSLHWFVFYGVVIGIAVGIVAQLISDSVEEALVTKNVESYDQE